ncbi:MAG: helix-turn-helix domain-containing protein [Chloroflexi bacterium]|nr:helix-turn-helix domain-containing protein [Chloroflexota bacterium]
MIDPHKTGAYIARLRKERDWTQLELADRLHVTHQAVSRWETGDSFPDLGTLAQLAQVLKVRMESLLDGGQTSPYETARGKVLAELAEGHAEQVAQVVKADPSELDTLIESGPLTRPSLMNRIVRNMTGYQFTMQQVMSLAPFVGQELLDSMVAGLSEKPDAQSAVELAPFLSRPELNRLVGQLEGGAVGMKHLIELAPFLDQPLLDRLTGQVTEEKIESHHAMSLAPFVSRAVLDKLVERLPHEALDIDQVISLAPFLDRNRLAGLVSRIGTEQVKPGDLIALAPFLDRQAVQKLVGHIPPEAVDAHTIVELSPFLDRPTLEGLIRGQRQNPPARE